FVRFDVEVTVDVDWAFSAERLFDEASPGDSTAAEYFGSTFDFPADEFTAFGGNPFDKDAFLVFFSSESFAQGSFAGAGSGAGRGVFAFDRRYARIEKGAGLFDRAAAGSFDGDRDRPERRSIRGRQEQQGPHRGEQDGQTSHVALS